MDNAYTEARFGRFTVNEDLLRQLDQGALELIFARMVVLHAEHSVVAKTIVYTAAHPEFEQVADANLIPIYNINLVAEGTDPDHQTLRVKITKAA